MLRPSVPRQMLEELSLTLFTGQPTIFERENVFLIEEIENLSVLRVCRRACQF